MSLESDRCSHPTLADLVSDHLSRRGFMHAGLGTMALGFFGNGMSSEVIDQVPFSFESVPVSLSDRVTVPRDYVAQVFYPWGHPIDGISPAFRPDASCSAADQLQQAGMGHDGMQWFAWPGDEGESSLRGLLVMNHEYTDQGLLFTDGLEPMTAEKVAKSQAAHGASVIAVEWQEGEWKIVPSIWSRRITARNPMELTGPAVGNPKVKTAADPTGRFVLGTLSNCASGKTPWGTYLTCEENFQGYFGTGAEEFTTTADLKRYGLRADGITTDEPDPRGIFQWWKHDPRFDLSTYPNESNRFGYVVEIDPSDPAAIPRKHTALGRFKHENAAVTLATDGRVVVYMADDEMNEYIYKFVSKNRYQPEALNRPLNLDLLTEGTLYVARFIDGNKGQWIALTHGENGLTSENGFSSQGDVAIRTRQAADRVGATMMDRPEWIAVHPDTGEVFATLTNNKLRGKGADTINPVDGTALSGKSEPPTDAANPRAKNIFGHIIKWREKGTDASATEFEWDIFLLAGDPTIDPRVSIKGDSFGSPDGISFDSRGILWIQTDVSTSSIGKDKYANLGNNMMLAADPKTGTVRRFLTGPNGCEVTGMAMTPDLKTMFVNIQHPGETAMGISDSQNPMAVSQWPDGPTGGRPRPATVVIRRKDGGVIGG